ncbi:hypothetical protein [Salirhabdus salicampi]|uniref:hypothetical protein n=1 Tax=Salirhabdus salicampi TaxID=476102 RepID=UPI0020C2C5E3|nr:hypothetical protein [Salirhabdus salicampi]MCP8615953.1 hypothetical protein [Salirhabdus salicampi]
MEEIFLAILFFVVGLFILYVIIETAVRRGINSSVIGRLIEDRHGIIEDKKEKEKKKSFLDNDLDD